MVGATAHRVDIVELITGLKDRRLNHRPIWVIANASSHVEEKDERKKMIKGESTSLRFAKAIGAERAGRCGVEYVTHLFQVNSQSRRRLTKLDLIAPIGKIPYALE